MKIAILLLNQGRGSGEVARQHAKHLIRDGHEVVFMHPRVGAGVDGAVNLDIELDGRVMPVHEYLPAAGENQRSVSAMDHDEAAAYLGAYERVLESVAADVDMIYGHHANLSAVVVHDVARRHDKPYVLFLHGTGIEPRHAGHYDDRIWERIREAVMGANGIIVTTEYVRDALVRPVVPVPEERFIVLPCGVDLHDFRPDGGGDVAARYALPAQYVICPGALTASKGPQNVVAASEHFADLAPIVFIGDGELRPELEAALGDRGRCLGFVPDRDKSALINAATLLTAAPAKKEHFGIIYAEALAAGTPPVTYEGGGVGSVVTPDCGVLTERSPEALGTAIRGLLADPDRRADLAAAGRTRAESCFDYTRLVARLEAWLAGLAAAY